MMKAIEGRRRATKNFLVEDGFWPNVKGSVACSSASDLIAHSGVLGT
jgi:hypothetical protein